MGAVSANQFADFMYFNNKKYYNSYNICCFLYIALVKNHWEIKLREFTNYQKYFPK